LPKAIRKNFVPVPDFVRAALERMPFADGSLTQALGRELTRMTGVRLDDDAWADVELEDHLRMRIEVVDAVGKPICAGRDYSALCAQIDGLPLQAAMPVAEDKPKAPAQMPGSYALPDTLVRKQAGIAVNFHPAWVEQGEDVVEQLFDVPQVALREHRFGIQRLLLQSPQLNEQARYLRQKLTTLKDAAIYYRDLGTQKQLTDDVLLGAIDRVFLPAGAPLPRDAETLAALIEAGRGDWVPVCEQLASQVLAILKQWHGLRKRFKGKVELAHALAMNDVREQLSELVFPGFARQVPGEWLSQYPRYLSAIEQRLDKLPGQVPRDRAWTDELQGYWQQYKALSERFQREGRWDPRLEEWRWMLEEYRVSLFAQQLGTRMPVSGKRLAKLWREITA